MHHGPGMMPIEYLNLGSKIKVTVKVNLMFGSIKILFNSIPPSTVHVFVTIDILFIHM